MNKKLINNIDSITSIGIVRTIIIMVVLAVIVWLMFFRKEKPKPTTKPVPHDAPEEEGGTSQDMTSAEVERIATALYNEIEGVNAWTRKLAPYKDFSNLSDSNMVRVYNYYNQHYQSKHSETLYQAMKNENYYFGGGFSWFDRETVRHLVYETILPRMERLNIT